MRRSGNDADTIVQEVFAFFGEENEEMALQFLKIFGGRSIRLPKIKVVRNAIQSVRAYMRCEEMAEANNSREYILDHVARELGMEPNEVDRKWKFLKKQLVRLEKEVSECLADLKRKRSV
jgi:hypothetical protein